MMISTAVSVLLAVTPTALLTIALTILIIVLTIPIIVLTILIIVLTILIKALTILINPDNSTDDPYFPGGVLDAAGAMCVL